MEHLKGIPGTVADGKNGPVTGNHFFSVDFQPCKLSVFAAQSGNLSLEPHLAAQGNDPLAEILHHFQKNIGAHMGLGVKEDVLSCACRHHLLQHPADPGIVDTGIQLAVGEGSGAAFTKLDIGLRIQRPSLPELPHLFVTGCRVITPFQHQGPESGLGQDQCSEHACRSKSHHHRSVFRFCFGSGRLVVADGCDRCPLAATGFQYFVFVAVHRHIHGVDDLDIRLFPGIHRPLHQSDPPDLGIGYLQQPRRLIVELGNIVLRRQRDFSNSDHCDSFPALKPAQRPEDQAHWRLYPPQSPSISSTSPQA